MLGFEPVSSDAISSIANAIDGGSGSGGGGSSGDGSSIPIRLIKRRVR